MSILKKTKPFLLRLLKFCRIGLGSSLLLFVLLNQVFPLKVNIEYSKIITSKEGRVLHAFITEDEKWRMYTELYEITPDLSKAIIHKEDKYFNYHWGVNPIAIFRAVINNTFYGKRTSGASTITMQVARMLNPKDRTYGNKLVEIFRAFQLELNYTKPEILQLYLNLVPYGGNIEGVKSASLLYFDKLPNHLSPAEITTLAIIPNRPTSLSIGTNNEYIMLERNKWLKRFQEEGVFTKQVCTDAINEDLTAYRLNAPNLAPHFSNWMKSKGLEEPIIKSTLVHEKQLKVEQLVANYIKRMKLLNINNAAVLVVDNKTHEVVTYVGSADFFDDADAGQVDGTRAVRSPGSTLKPLVYGAAFDKGLITPMTIMHDIPTNFGGYEPENYEGGYKGKITVEAALATSRNIPAVKALELLGTKKMIELLQLAGFKTIEDQSSDLGLSLILGGCGVTLQELTGLYSSHANGGRWYPLKYLQSDTSHLYKQLLSPEANYMVVEILTKLMRPDLPPSYANSNMHIPKVAWKTGTSYGRKDAWSIGFNSKYTIGVWIGNFSAEGSPELNGAGIATPLLFELFNTLDYNSQERWFTQPPGLDIRHVCNETGDIPANYCEHLLEDYYIPGKSLSQPCNHLKWVFISEDEQMSYCRTCLPPEGYTKKLYPNISAELLRYYTDQHVNYIAIPAHNPNCTRIQQSNYPTITSPNDNSEYFLDKLDPQQLMLRCDAHNDVKKVYWYINDKLFQETDANKPVFFNPPMGNVKISCSDDKGRNTDIYITVQTL